MDAALRPIHAHLDPDRLPVNDAWFRTSPSAILEVVDELTHPRHGGPRQWLVNYGVPAAALDQWIATFVEL